MDYPSATEDSIPLRHTPVTIMILLTAYLSVLVIGLASNVFFIIVVVKMPQMKTATKYFIVNLAIADLLVLLFCLLPNLISNIYVPWVMGSFMCKAVPYIQGVSVWASVYSLAAISADRLMAIRVQLRRQITTRVARKIIAWIWILGAGLALPWLLYFDLSNTDKSDPSLVFCTEIWPSQLYGNIYFIVVNLGLFYLFPLSFIYFCHFCIWLGIRRGLGPSRSSVSQIDLLRRTAKASVQKFVIAVVVGFAACWVPLYVIFIRIKLIPVELAATEEKVLDYALPIAQWLGAANSCINPILYGFFNRNFRCTLQRLFQESCAFKRSKNCSSSQNRQKNPHVGLNLVRLSITLYRRRHSKNSPLKNVPPDAVDSGVVNMFTLHQKNPRLAAITHSQTYTEAMGNPCTPIKTDTIDNSV